MYNFPLYYIHVASYKTPGNNHKKEQGLYKAQALELLQSKLIQFQVNGNKTEQLSDTSYLVHLTNSTDPIVVSVLFDLDYFKRHWPNFFYRLSRSEDKMLAFIDILSSDYFCVDLSVLKDRGKFVNTKLLTTTATNPLIIEDEFEESNVISNIQLGDILLKIITENILISNTNTFDSLNIFLLHNCYYQPRQIVSLCNEAYLTINAVLDIKGDKYLLTTENDEYCNLLEAYNSVLDCVRKIDYCQLQYAHIEYCDLFS